MEEFYRYDFGSMVINEPRLVKYQSNLTIEDVSFSHWYIFSRVLQNPSIAKGLIELIWQTEVQEIKEVGVEKNILNGVDVKDIRLDFLLVDDKQRHFVIEMQNYNKDLLKRCDYYSSSMTVASLDKGEDYRKLNGSYLALICTLQPFKENHPIYHFEMKCQYDDVDEKYNTEVKIINTKGYEFEENRQLVNLMRYIEFNEIAKDDVLVKEIDAEVRRVKKDKRWRNEFMRLEMHERDVLETGIEIGREEGLKEGEIKGRKEGEIKGRLEACKNIIELKFHSSDHQWLNHLSIEQLDEVIRLSFNIDDLEKIKQISKNYIYTVK